MKASARSNPPYGYKAVIIHAGPPKRYSETLAREWLLLANGTDCMGINGHNFPTRAAAIEYANKVIAARMARRNTA